jgi:hypothetical protein
MSSRIKRGPSSRGMRTSRTDTRPILKRAATCRECPASPTCQVRFQILQFPDRVVLYEHLHAVREIYTDGSTHPDVPVEFWLGDSRGLWEGATLVVDITQVHQPNVVRSRGKLS